MLSSCLNPFAPIEGDTGMRSWRDQLTVGGLLHNFELAYDYRDSLHYADCIAEMFEFHYYDEQNGRYDSWHRETDLKATGGLFRSYTQVDLEWNQVPGWVDDFDEANVTIDSLVVRFNLTLGDDAPLMGYARFSVRKEIGDKFKVIVWRDDF